MSSNDPGFPTASGNWPWRESSIFIRESSTTQKEKVEIWFIEPLERMCGNEGFVCLMVCFPLIETVLRFEFKIPADQDVPFSDGSPALHWFASFMQIPEVQARNVWDAFRNGLLHRAMVKSSVQYALIGGKHGRPAEYKDGTVFIYVWDLRDALVRRLWEHHSKLWRDPGNALAGIQFSS